MFELRREAEAHGLRREARERHAARLVAFRLATGLDLEAALAASGTELRRAIVRVERLLERERQRGWARHWSYDLNRHIALSEALGELRLAASGAGRETRSASP
ncbi:MAG: cytoplasmic protein [Rhizobiaceae bacterium]